MADVVHEALKVPASVRNQSMPTPAEVDAAIARVLQRVDRALPLFVERFPAPSSVHLTYGAIDNVEWTNGFWTGMLWLAFELTGERRYREAAQTQVKTFASRIERRVNVDHHDLGFLYTLSSCAAWKLTGDRDARNVGIAAAESLLSRFSSVAQVIQAWGDLHDPEQAGRMIIDCNLNLPLLYWAGAETGDLRFRQAADQHLRRAAALLVRPDASTFHTFFVDTTTGAPRFGRTHQGYSDDSCWARGQAWGIYGFALGYTLSGMTDLVSLAAALANYYLNRLPDDLICHWDLIFTQGEQPRDTSAAAIATCGLLELVRHLPLSDPHRAHYAQFAWATLQQLDRNHLAPLDGANGVLVDAVYHWPNGVGVNESCIWGDYFYLEALMRIRRTWAPYW